MPVTLIRSKGRLVMTADDLRAISTPDAAQEFFGALPCSLLPSGSMAVNIRRPGLRTASKLGSAAR